MLLKANGYEVRSAAVWTYNARVAFVISVVEQGVSRTVTPLPMTPPAAAIKQPLPTHDAEKLKRLKQRCVMLMDHQNAGVRHSMQHPCLRVLLAAVVMHIRQATLEPVVIASLCDQQRCTMLMARFFCLHSSSQCVVC